MVTLPIMGNNMISEDKWYIDLDEMQEFDEDDLEDSEEYETEDEDDSEAP